MDIEVELDRILRRYKLCESHKEMRQRMYYLVQKRLDEIGEAGKRVAIRCAGWHTYFLLREFSELLEVDYLIDSNPDSVIDAVKNYKIPIVSNYDQIQDQVDCIIISTFDHRDEIKQELKKFDFCEIIDLYDYLKANGYETGTEFYNFYNEPYKILIEKKQQYLKEDNLVDKEKICAELISEFLGNRDFISAFKWIEEYAVHKYKDYYKMSELKNELMLFLDKIRRTCDERQKKDIYWFWQDGLQYYIVDKMPFLSSMKAKGLWFENSYTNSAVTRSVYGNILDKELEVERYRTGKSTARNHLLTKFLIKNGYKCYKIGKEETQKIDLNEYNYAKATEQISFNVPLTELYWNALRMSIMSETPLLLLIHSGVETHIPCMAPNLDAYKFNGLEYLAKRFTKEGREEFLRHLEKCVTYLDEELMFYRNIIGDNPIKIYMSDHGDVLSEKSYKFTRDCAQTVLAIESEDIEPHHIEMMFQTSDYLELFKYILHPTVDNEKHFCRKEIRINGVDFYNKDAILKYQSMGWKKYGLAYDGFITPIDRYILLATGEEMYSRREADYENVIDDPQYENRVNYFRNRLANEECGFIQINSNPKFKNSKLMYDELKQERVVKTI